MTAFVIALVVGVASWTGLSVLFARFTAQAIAIANAEEPPLEQ